MNRRLFDWIKELKSLKLKPEFKIVKEIERPSYPQLEESIEIERCLVAGHDLFNMDKATEWFRRQRRMKSHDASLT